MYAPSWHAKPSATTLRTHSHVKIAVKTWLASCSAAPRREAGSMRGESRTRQMEETTMMTMMKRSKCLLPMRRWQRRRVGLVGAKRHSALSPQQPVALALALALALASALASAFKAAASSTSSSSSSAKASRSTVMKMLSSRKRPTTRSEMKKVGATGDTSACPIMMSNHEPDMTTKVESIAGPM
jgi:hypothetical protein